MKTEQEIKEMISDLENKCKAESGNRDNAKNESDYAVAQNLVLIYVMQIEILLEVLK